MVRAMPDHGDAREALRCRHCSHYPCAHAQAQLEHQHLRILNQELLLKYGDKAWRAQVRCALGDRGWVVRRR